MTEPKKSILLVFAAVFFFAALVILPSIAGTPAGTQIQTSGMTKYYSESGAEMPIANSNSVTTVVSRITSVNVTPTSDSKQVDVNGKANFLVSVKNTGNSSDTFSLNTVTQNGSIASIYRDDNGDGQLQSTETTKISTTGSLTAGSALNCIVSVQMPLTVTSTDAIAFQAGSSYDATKTAKAQLTVKRQDSAYIRTWLIHGYYAEANTTTSLATDYLGGEANVAPDEGSILNNRPWFRLDSPSEVIDLSGALYSATNCVGYAHVYVYSPTNQSVSLWLGSDDGIKVWLNGAVVWNNNVYRSLTVDQDKFQVNLNAGWNRMLVKVSNGAVSWAFTAKFCDSNGVTVPGLVYSASKQTVSDKTAPNIANIKITPGSTSAVIEWDTDEPASTLVDYGTALSDSRAHSDEALVTHHTVTLNNLTPETTYSVGMGSADASGNITWSETSFQTTAQQNTNNLYVKSWLVNGYYPNSTSATRMSTDYLGGEASVVPTEGSNSGGKTWFKLDSQTDTVDLGAALSAATYCAGYTHAYVYSPTDQRVSLWLASDDGIKAWLNGTVVWNNDAYRGLIIDQDKLQVDLKAGWNRLLVKVTNGRGSWRLTAKFCDSNGNALPGLVYSASKQTVSDNTAPFIDNITITPSSTSAVVEWDTDEPASTLVTCGTYDYSDETLVTRHTVTLNGLTPVTVYVAGIGSADASGNIAWSEGNFQTKAVQSGTSGLYVRSWLINGYHKASISVRMSTDYLGGEANVAPAEGSVSGGLTWFKADSATDYIDLGKGFANPTGCVAYANVYVYSPVAQSANIWAGSDDGIKLWLNGAVVWNNDVYRSMVIDQDKIPVNLMAGWNRLLVKVTQGGSSWGFTLKFCDSSGNQIPGILYSTGS